MCAGSLCGNAMTSFSSMFGKYWEIVKWRHIRFATSSFLYIMFWQVPIFEVLSIE